MMTYEEMHKVAGEAVASLKNRLGPQGTVIILMTNEEGAHVVNWNWSHPMVALGLSHLGVDAIMKAIVKPDPKGDEKKASSFKLLNEREPR